MSKRTVNGVTMPWRVVVLIIGFAIALVLAATLVRPAHADGPVVLLEVYQRTPQEVGASLPTTRAVVATRWDTGDGPRFVWMVECHTSAGRFGAFEMTCLGWAAYGGGAPPFFPARGNAWAGYTFQHPFWVMAVGLREDGTLVASQPVLINPAGIWDYTRPTANRFD